MTNPFFTDWKTKHRAIPYDLIKLEHFMPAIEKGLELAYENIRKIKEDTSPPTFENTILALETINEGLDDPVSVYYNLRSTESDSEFKKLADTISPLLAQLSSTINTDKIIFDKIKTIFDNKESYNLNSEQERLLEITYKKFVRNGALLDDEKKNELKEIDKELSVLSPQFSKNVLDATNAFYYHTTNKDEIDGLPENDIKAAENRARQKNFEEGWLFNLQIPSYSPFMTYANNRELRRMMYLEYSRRAYCGEFDNRDILLKEAKLKYKRANLLGYETHAEYVLENRMAETPINVEDFLERIYDVAMPIAKKEIKELRAYAESIAGTETEALMPWDTSYYSEKLKKEKFGFDSEELRPYFKLENCIKGIFKVAEKLYGLKFELNKEYPVYHKDVNVYEVSDQENNFIGLLYIDLFPRETKSGGAWMNNVKTQGLRKGKMERPHIMVVGNMTPSSENTPSLLTLGEVETLFHEFGHALHGLLSDCTYTALASPNVYWDFVELPSQIMENWVLEEETLALFAFHYDTGEVIPKELVEKVKAAQNFNKGIQNIRQLSFGFLDFAWHNVNPTTIEHVQLYEESVLEKVRLLPRTIPTCSSTSFSHIFSGGYSAGYYSYKWAEVLDADAFEKFKEDGIFNKETAKSFRENILARGNTEHPMDLYVRFRGRKPDPDAMLKRDGLLSVDS